MLTQYATSRVNVRKACFGEKANHVAGHSFNRAEEIHSTSSAEAWNRITQKRSVADALSKGMKTCDIPGQSTRF